MIRPIAVLNEEERLRLTDTSVEACVRALDEVQAYSVPEGSIEIAFVDPAVCSHLHEAFFGDPDPTDVMTFPGDPSDGHAGDIAICPAVALDAYKESGLSFPAELTLYLVHAWLHLAGLKDDAPEAREEMRKGESLLMAHVESSCGFLDCEWVS